MNMNIENNAIEKLKVLKVNKNNLIVENTINKRGIILIKNVSYYYVEDLSRDFKEGDTIYGILIETIENRRFYSLKIGHDKKKVKLLRETGGGNLGIYFLLNKINKKEKRG